MAGDACHRVRRLRMLARRALGAIDPKRPSPRSDRRISAHEDRERVATSRVTLRSTRYDDLRAFNRVAGMAKISDVRELSPAHCSRTKYAGAPDGSRASRTRRA